VGEGTGGSLQVAPHQGSLDDSAKRDAPEIGVVTTDEVVPPSEYDIGRRRFTWAVLIAIVCTAIPFVWILWSDWGPPTPLRQTIYENNFFDLQARAIFHGHLALQNGALGIEGFIHDGRTYTYFGLFPSIIRMPILLVTSSLDAKLTPSSILFAWLLTGLFASLLLWRVRYLVRGESVMGRTEATGYGFLMAAIMGGTIWMLLASIPYVFNEDIAWSICLTIGAIFALLGVIERPTWGRVIASGLLILCTNLDRATTGWACAVAAGLVAFWFFLGFGGQEGRRWFLPVLGAGLIPLVIGCTLNYAKFGVPFGVPITDQVWSHVNAYRERFLAANHNSEVGTEYAPTNLITYLRPDGLSISRVFPFVSLPTGPPTALNGVLFDKLYRTASISASSPLLFLLSLWGLVTAFRPNAVGKVAWTRLLLLAAGSAGAALLLWGYIGPRYLGDFVPFLVLASAVAMADIFRRLERSRRSVRIGVVSLIALLGLFSIAANVGMAIVPNDEWDSTQLLNYVQAQKSLSDITGHPLQAHVSRGSALPPWAPAGQLYVVGNCSGLYISNGENYSTVPSQQLTRSTWMAVQLGQPFQHTFRLMANDIGPGKTELVPLVTAGNLTFKVSATSTSGHRVVLRFGIFGGAKTVESGLFEVDEGTSHTVVVTTDPAKHIFETDMDGEIRGASDLTLTGGEKIRVDSTSAHSQNEPNVLRITRVAATPTLCQSLIH